MCILLPLGGVFRNIPEVPLVDSVVSSSIL